MNTVEERVESLEQEVAQLKRQLGLANPVRKSWQSTVGMFANDPTFDEVMEAGQKWREGQTYEKEIAGA